jgi:hypothetical protein
LRKVIELIDDNNGLQAIWNEEEELWHYHGYLRESVIKDATCPKDWGITMVCQFLWSIMEGVV